MRSATLPPSGGRPKQLEDAHHSDKTLFLTLFNVRFGARIAETMDVICNVRTVLLTSVIQVEYV